ncbi:cell wall hydrolase [Aliihoeflea sp. 2WW]|uniref:cell wall hydrolase n=1 Tax=Aliihoeflea sp. 2WW TaxID=1381123 RepID=UPI000464A0A1|nr:cell wall hydrolase [Aliihoeflea sp. 2WW]
MFFRLPAAACAVALSLVVSACTSSSDLLDDVVTSSVKPVAATASNRDCMARAMFFESHRSSREGLVAVGTVVMNRVNSGEYPNTICGVVGQKNQFAPGVMTRKMNSKAMPDVMAAADAVLAGERHPMVQNAKFFHTAGLNFPYPNMHYVLKAGGNAFYEKRGREERAANGVRPQSQLAAAGRVEGKQARVQVAAAPQPQPQAERFGTPQPAPAVPQMETAEAAAPANTASEALSFAVDQTNADAIGALILDQTRTGSTN